MKYVATVEDQNYEVEINSEHELTLDGVRLQVDFQSAAAESVFSLIVNGRSYEACVYPTDAGLEVMLAGRMYHVIVEDERERLLRQASVGPAVQRGDYHLRAPMPGLVVTVPIEEGQQVARGDILVILESMKMQNELKAPREGIITNVRVRTGDRVDQNQVMVTLS